MHPDFESNLITHIFRNYGQNHTIVSAYMNKSVNTPPIKAYDRVTYNNFECLSYKYFMCPNVYVTALLVLPPFWFGMFEVIPFSIFYRLELVTGIFWYLSF